MNTGRLFFGAILVGLGIVYALDAANVADGSRIVAEWWPIAIVWLGVVDAAGEGRLTMMSTVLIVVGGALVGVTTGAFGRDAWGLVWPIALIGGGAWIMTGWGRSSHLRAPASEEISTLAILSATRTGSTSSRFRRGAATAVLGGVTVDLTEATPAADGARLAATAILGSVDILVPHGWAVTVRGLPLLGGWDDTTDRAAAGPGSPRLEVVALAVLGGIEVKHSSRWGR